MNTERIMRESLVWNRVALALAAFFLFGAYSNASGVSAQAYVNWGYPEGFHVVTAACELLVAIALVFPRTRVYGAVLGTMVMVAALATLVLNGAAERAVPALLTLAVSVAVGIHARRVASRASACPCE